MRKVSVLSICCVAITASVLFLAPSADHAAAAPPRTAPAQPAVRAAQPPAAGNPNAQPPAPQFADSHILVRVKPGVERTQLPDGRPTFAEAGRAPSTSLAQTLSAAGATSVRRALTFAPARPALASQIGLDRWHRIDLAPGADPAQLVAQLAKSDLIELAELDGIGGIASPPNDPSFGLQYAMQNTGQLINGFPGVAGADIRSLDAWSITTGSSDTIIAVLDSGVNAHADLSGRLLPGFNFSQLNGNTADGCNHGTHVAGIIAANTNNTAGIAGVNWSAKILPVVVLNGCNGPETMVADGVTFAADQGAHVINLSLQYYTGTTYFHNAIQYARASGCVIVAAAGNFNAVVAFPARWPEVIGVAATNNRDLRYGGSNQGPELSVAAPGESVYSLHSNGTYFYNSGTSMASPHVAGVASLMLSVDPTLSHDDIESMLQSTAVDLGDPGFDNSFGHGRINAHAALLAVIDNLPVFGDLNDDGIVDVLDLLILLAAWGPCPALPDPCPADLNESGTVDVQDLLLLLSNWG